jgi:hypothetical protein
MPSEQDIQYALEALEREEEAGYGNCNAKG